MSDTQKTRQDLRRLKTDEIDAASGAGIHLHVKGLFHLAIGQHGASIGVLGYGADDSDGAFTFTFD